MSLLAGCASRPEGVLVPVGDAASPGTTKVDLVVATTRRPSDKPGILFSGERDKLVSLNEIVVSIPPEKPQGG